MSVVEALASNWMVVLVGIAALVLVIFAWLEYEEDKTASEVGAGVGDRSKRAIGGGVGFLSALTVGVMGGLYEAGMSLGELGAELGDIFVNAPELISGIVVAGVGTIGLSGAIQISTIQFVGIAIVALGIGGIVGLRRGTF
ncbi:hypothetical protein E6P09_07620 [Haloferax mediterranei ATCC 33500]|uniref:Uncharacterized protein n=1 Tax=Haloferax mediterranei (strain ATCC 33500 / DSM 1411 / JCM 8866 / NBRC 14739 / NCIMB 2177 / R-4) TaxID=523841 RepID=I3R326_HALMT|nr:hypothetical protein [Haloferax mediterranei]AFK18636.1 hypothetical protein HFX_0915 [Haloferax mediterranei ATCC 33500]AHZ21992.1 hypothetical protein BM92_04640 [Haloferax mediterranei ATCC 33500]EMA02088.1 hypothetical protein C439_05895 [Haloferax mediterranei ATCC 33500]MDX5988729.1 hypothetical protein [Haloferax mediterranei ATCC 33500]QCQ75136.1 hypothetical protein E6P09_07620 [Haloferax mediterranei ATCC 33500]